MAKILKDSEIEQCRKWLGNLSLLTDEALRRELAMLSEDNRNHRYYAAFMFDTLCSAVHHMNIFLDTTLYPELSREYGTIDKYEPYIDIVNGLNNGYYRKKFDDTFFKACPLPDSTAFSQNQDLFDLINDFMSDLLMDHLHKNYASMWGIDELPEYVWNLIFLFSGHASEYNIIEALKKLNWWLNKLKFSYCFVSDDNGGNSELLFFHVND